MPRQNASVSPTVAFLTLVATGTANRTSSGSPATAGLRSRTASRSVMIATRPMPAAAISSMPGMLGTGGA